MIIELRNIYRCTINNGVVIYSIEITDSLNSEKYAIYFRFWCKK